MHAFSNFRTWVQGSKLLSEGNIQPTEISATYRIRIEFETGERPKIFVISPPLLPIEGKIRVKHTYSKGNLCLYLPNNGEWSDDMSLAHSIVPWISTWLFYYEMWHTTGEWLGGGHEPDLTDPHLEEGDIEIDENTQR